jgi:predicted ATP-grasp superfamily ATP-dependent carboligase
LFQHLRIREDPPSGGVSVFCQSVTLSPKLADYSVRLLRAMHWEGVAMVEYRYNAEADRAILMEVNGRFWGSLPLALHAGIDFPYLLYRSTLEGVGAPPQCRYKVGVKCRLIAGDTKWLYSVLASGLLPPFKACMEYLSAFRPGIKYYGWSLDDPLPAIMNFVLRLRGLLASSMRRISSIRLPSVS